MARRGDIAACGKEHRRTRDNGADEVAELAPAELAANEGFEVGRRDRGRCTDLGTAVFRPDSGGGGGEDGAEEGEGDLPATAPADSGQDERRRRQHAAAAVTGEERGTDVESNNFVELENFFTNYTL